VVGNPWKNWLFVRDGYLSPPAGPGPGVELDLEEVSKHPCRQGNWLPLFKQDRERREGGE
jgi:galactonate dehydratase